MPRLVQWEQQIGRRLRLRDLFVFFTVVGYGSMAKAAGKLGVSTPSISEVICGGILDPGTQAIFERPSAGESTGRAGSHADGGISGAPRTEDRSGLRPP